MNKPPLGLIPPEYCDYYFKRYQEVVSAIDRYLHHSEFIKIPVEWVCEYNSLCDFLQKRMCKTEEEK